MGDDTEKRNLRRAFEAEQIKSKVYQEAFEKVANSAGAPGQPASSRSQAARSPPRAVPPASIPMPAMA
eukprot:8001050-Alexandrium_andersonii.AAC.1